jgi:diguanylate cyclase (GGDEF)-like protein/PAS domain S-box-containing protein
MIKADGWPFSRKSGNNVDDNFSFRDIAELAQDVIIVTKAEPLDPPGPIIVYVNPAFTKLTGYTYEEAIGQNPRILQGLATDPETTHKIREGLNRIEPIHVAIQNYTKDGRTYWLDLSIMPLKNRDGKVSHFVAIERDVSVQKALQQQLAEQAERDPLTGLYNRRRFFEKAALSWNAYVESGEVFAVLAFDIDFFKSVNDTYGHDTGDSILQHIAHQLQSACTNEDLVARIGGEEFSMILSHVTPEEAMGVAERIRSTVESSPLILASGPLKTTISIGIAVVDPRDKTTDSVLKRADLALYQSKQSGRNRSTLLPIEDLNI